MELVVNYGSGVVAVPEAALKSGAGDFELAVLVRVCAFRGEDSGTFASRIAKELNRRPSDVESALNFWRGAGILTFRADNAAQTASKPETPAEEAKVSKAPPSAEPPIYTGIEAASIIDKTAGMKNLIDECQKTMGKLFCQSEINRIVGLSDYLGLSNEHILMIVMYCKGQGKNNMHYIEKMAYELYDEGVTDAAALEAYIRSQERYSGVEAKLKDYFGFGSRTLTSREKEYFHRWIAEWQFGCDLISMAYEITIDSTKEHTLSMPYLNKILDNWHAAGYKTTDEVMAAREARKQQRDGQQARRTSEQSSFNTDDFFEAALRRSYEKLSRGSGDTASSGDNGGNDKK